MTSVGYVWVAAVFGETFFLNSGGLVVGCQSSFGTVLLIGDAICALSRLDLRQHAVGVFVVRLRH